MPNPIYVAPSAGTITYDQISHGFSLVFPHLSIVISMKEKNILRRYINEPGLRGNNDKIFPPRVITIKIGLPYKSSQYR
jgi:hypothetical protein